MKGLTPAKKKKGQSILMQISNGYTPHTLEFTSLLKHCFDWIEEKAGIECASKVHSY